MCDADSTESTLCNKIYAQGIPQPSMFFTTVHCIPRIPYNARIAHLVRACDKPRVNITSLLARHLYLPVLARSSSGTSSTSQSALSDQRVRERLQGIRGFCNRYDIEITACEDHIRPYKDLKKVKLEDNQQRAHIIPLLRQIQWLRGWGIPLRSYDEAFAVVMDVLAHRLMDSVEHNRIHRDMRISNLEELFRQRHGNMLDSPVWDKCVNNMVTKEVGPNGAHTKYMMLFSENPETHFPIGGVIQPLLSKLRQNLQTRQFFEESHCKRPELILRAVILVLKIEEENRKRGELLNSCLINLLHLVQITRFTYVVMTDPAVAQAEREFFHNVIANGGLRGAAYTNIPAHIQRLLDLDIETQQRQLVIELESAKYNFMRR